MGREGNWKEQKKKPSEVEISEPEETSELDTDKFKNSLVNVEASGEKDYSLINPTSSAVGPYQFLYDTHKDILKSKGWYAQGTLSKALSFHG